jgi:arabinogalactan oligomer/maltooligosaccharide transport system permease protein
MTGNETYALRYADLCFRFEEDWQSLIAAAMIVTLPAVLVLLVAQRYFVSGLTRGGAKR